MQPNVRINWSFLVSENSCMTTVAFQFLAVTLEVESFILPTICIIFSELQSYDTGSRQKLSVIADWIYFDCIYSDRSLGFKKIFMRR